MMSIISFQIFFLRSDIFNFFSPDKFLQQGLPPPALRTEEQNSKSGAFPHPATKWDRAKFRSDAWGMAGRFPGAQFFPSQSLIRQPPFPSMLCGHRVPGAGVPAKAEAQTLPQLLVFRLGSPNGESSATMPIPPLILSLDLVFWRAAAEPIRSPVKGPPLTSWRVDMQNSYVRCGGGAHRGWQAARLLPREEARESAWFSDWDKLDVSGAGAVHSVSVLNPGCERIASLGTWRQRPLEPSVPGGTRFTSRTQFNLTKECDSDVGETPLFATRAPTQAWLQRFL